MILTKQIAYLYKKVLKPIYFKRDPEDVHDRMLSAGEFLGKYSLTRKLTSLLFEYKDQSLVQEIQGVRFVNPVGLSAGFDKDARLLNILPKVGFGFEEAGTITYHSYAGNPKPRLTRLPKSQGLVVYYGLKNEGVKKILDRVAGYKHMDEMALGLSFARTNSSKTVNDIEGIQDIVNCFKAIVDSNLGDYYTLNISCPNTFGGEPFTTPNKLNELLTHITEVPYSKPLFIKMPVDLEWSEFDKLLQVIVKFNLAGVVISNLTKKKDGELIKDDIDKDIKGGISGLPTRELSLKLIRNTHKKYGDKLTIIGVGGIFSAKDAYDKILAGASLLQLITGMIYQGPQLIGEINRGLAELLKDDGYKNISEAVGKDSRNTTHK